MGEMTVIMTTLHIRPGLDRPTAGYLLKVCLSAQELLCRARRKCHTDTEKRAFPLIGNETSRSIIRNAHSRQYFSRPQMAMR